MKTNSRTAALIMILSTAAASAWATGERRPNVLIVVADDLGWADVGFHHSSDVRTPALDGLAQNGVRFAQGYVSAPQCSPSRAGFLTGRYQQRFGHDNNYNETACLDSGQRLLPEHFKPFGYTTGLVGKWNLGMKPEQHPLEHGYDEFFGFLAGGHAYSGTREQDANNPILRNRTPVDLKEYLTTALGREAAAFVRRHRDSPWFLQVAFNAPHSPLTMPDGYADQVRDIHDRRRAIFVAMMANLDDAIGEILGAVRETSQESRTLVVFFSDNGGTAGNTSRNLPYRGGKMELFEGGIRIPMVMSWPGMIAPGSEFLPPVTTLDLLPTVLAAAGGRPLPGTVLDGINLLPYLPKRNDENTFSRWPEERIFYWRWRDQRAIRAGDWKWMQRGKESPALFDLRTDPSENHDLSSQRPDFVRELGDRWAGWNNQNPLLPAVATEESP